MTCQDILVYKHTFVKPLLPYVRRRGRWDERRFIERSNFKAWADRTESVRPSSRNGGLGGQEAGSNPESAKRATQPHRKGVHRNLPASKQKRRVTMRGKGRRRKRMLEGEDTAIEEFHRSTPKKLQM
ncbi:hypothetical protein R1flu_021152 [Riccia fluitans]|uniref:Uncharacterized protein n=1 Tax=Riccia fluitans TaxID=41844 RepID=A0ABD1ZNI9_9MARC